MSRAERPSFTIPLMFGAALLIGLVGAVISRAPIARCPSDDYQPRAGFCAQCGDTGRTTWLDRRTWMKHNQSLISAREEVRRSY